MRRGWMVLALMAALAAAGCLTGETRHTIVLETDGSVTWIVQEDGVRSTENDPAAREREEREFLRQAGAGEQPVAAGLDSLGARSLEVEVLRAERPFSVRTRARFRSLERLATRWLEALQMPGEIRVDEDEGTAGFRLTVTAEGEVAGESDEVDRVAPLLTDADDYRLVLGSGRFVEAVGFRISDDGAVAVPVDDHCDDEATTCTFSLRWTRD